jgi:hypothetical protein
LPSHFRTAQNFRQATELTEAGASRTDQSTEALIVERLPRGTLPRMTRSIALVGLLLLSTACSSDDSGETADDSSSGGTSTGSGGTTSGSGGGTGAGGGIQPGPGSFIGECAMFPADNPWNQDISGAPLHVQSDAFIDSIGRDTNLHPDFGTVWDGAPIGIPYVLVGSDQEKVSVNFEYDDESDVGPYPVPIDVPIEGGPDSDGDRHVLVVDTDACMLYELYSAYPPAGGSGPWDAGSGAIYDLSSNELRPEGWTSADAAGLPILPGLARYDEVVEQGEILHALRFTVSQSQRAYIHPATHAASDSTDPALPPMGLRVRMKADYDCSGYSNEVQVICTALKRFGMFVADNGSDWYVSGAPDDRWSDENLSDLGQITGDAFEAVDTGPTLPWPPN